jgi:hypothetical protein
MLRQLTKCLSIRCVSTPRPILIRPAGCPEATLRGHRLGTSG